eukprot:PhF_6_TR1426/c0_g1_i5/m.2515
MKTISLLYVLAAVLFAVSTQAGAPDPTATPSVVPTSAPPATTSAPPTVTPTQAPTTVTPTDKPTGTPTQKPTVGPTETPTATPTATPTNAPTLPPPPQPQGNKEIQILMNISYSVFNATTTNQADFESAIKAVVGKELASTLLFLGAAQAPAPVPPTTAPTAAPTTIAPTTIAPTTVSPTQQPATTKAPTTLLSGVSSPADIVLERIAITNLTTTNTSYDVFAQAQVAIEAAVNTTLAQYKILSVTVVNTGSSGDDDSGKKLSSGAIAGVIVGVLIFILLLAFGFAR